MSDQENESEGRFDKFRRLILGDKPSWKPLANYCKNFQPTDYSLFHCQNGYRHCNEDCRNFEPLSQEEIERRDLVRRDFERDELQEILAEQKKPLSLTDEEGLPIQSLEPYERLRDRLFFLEKGRAIFPTINLTKQNIALILVCIGTVLVLGLIWIYFKWGYI